MTVGGLVDTVFRFNRLCECHLYTAPRNIRSEQPEEASEKFHAFAVAERCARLRETLRSQNKRVKSRALDLIIAATALEYGLTLGTKNTDDFKDIPDLILYQPPSGEL
jgi:predicted nucleic acid-binding protein